MSIIEIAKIKVRRGKANVEGVPQLDSGELGWALDTQELFIGNGTTDEGAPAIGNTRLLTEYDRPQFFNVSTSSYVYGVNRSPNIFTDPGGQADTELTVQAKLDSYVTMVDFGVLPGTPTYSSQGIQNAINQLYLNTDKGLASSRIKLRIPAGKYNITSTIYIPPNVTIEGDGKNKTILNLVNTGTSIFQVSDSTSVPGGPVILGNITSLGRPQNSNLIGMTFQYDPSITNYAQTLPLVRMDCLANGSIVDCAFIGNSSTSSSYYSGLEIRGQGAITTYNLTLDRVEFANMSRGILSNYDVQDIYGTHCSFKGLYRGISFSESLVTGNTVGPKNSRIVDSVFENILKEGWFIGTNTNNVNNISARNTYRNVGNNQNGDLQAVTPVIQFLSYGCTSVDDYFSRSVIINSTSTEATFYENVAGHASITENTVQLLPIATNLTPVVFTKLPYSGDDQSITVNYILRKPTAVISRKGTLNVSVSLDKTVSVSDNFNYSGSSDGGAIFSADLSTVTNTVSILYTSPDSDGTLEYKFNYLK